MTKMKDSGIRWIGEIPEEWSINKIKYEYKIQTGFTPDTSREDYYSDDGVTWISIADLTNCKNKIISESTSKISEKYIKEKHPAIVLKDSLLYSFKLSVGKVGFAGKDFYTNEAIASFQNEKNVCLNYLYYAAFLIEENANINIYGAKILNQDLINNSITIMPPLKEQQLIADFLNVKIKDIDKILDDLNKQVDILNRFKQSVITEEILGINNINMIQLPDGWKKSKLGYTLSVLTDYHANGSYETLSEHVTLLDDPDYALMIRTTDLEKKDYNNNVIYINEDAYHFLKKSKVFGNEVIINKIGSAGKVYYMPKLNRPVSLAMNQFLLRFKEGILSKYIYYYLKTKYAKEQISERVQGAVTLTITKEAVRSIPTIIPQYEIQVKIVDYLDNECSKIDEVISDKQNQIEKMERYKQSLIYEYVTGKKRVKGAEELYG